MKRFILLAFILVSVVTTHAADIKVTSPNVKLIGENGLELEGVAGSTSEVKLMEKVIEYSKTITKNETLTATRRYTFDLTIVDPIVDP